MILNIGLGFTIAVIIIILICASDKHISDKRIDQLLISFIAGCIIILIGWLFKI